MNKYIKIVLAFLSFGALCATTEASIGGYISASDKKKFLSTLVKSFTIELDDISKSYYAAKGYKILNEVVPKAYITEQCAHIKQHYKATANVEVLFNALNTWSLLGCDGKLHTDDTIASINSLLQNEKSTTADIRYATEILTQLKLQIPNPAKVAQLIQAKLKEDDSLASIGQALHAASLLGNAGKFAHDRIEDVIVQADEIDGKLLQWEGGLTVTSLLITGLLRLPGATPFTQVQADKFANYLLTRKTVQTPKGILSLLEAAVALAGSSVSPVSISIIGSSQVPQDKPELRIQVSDVFGQPLKPVPSPVIAQSATRISDDVVVLAKQPLISGKTSTEFVLTLDKLDPGYYRVAINAGSHSATITARILGLLTINSLEIGLTDADGSSAPKLSKLSYPTKLDSALKADSSQHLLVKFSISRPVHQAFLRLSSGKKEIVFLAVPDSNKGYKVEVNVASQLAYTGNFDMELILGDSIITNPIRWTLGVIDVNLGPSDSPAPRSLRGPKPEIKHLFRPAEKRPPEPVSLFFSGLTAAPLLVLLILWAKLGINFGNFTGVAIPFHLGFGSILGLFTLFWLKLDMFKTCALLIPLGMITFLAGHRLLSSIAARQKKTEKADK
ncbi:hypothetical protein NQ315_004711 [Exocentrus adspersus]|uniref:Dolichyl-diphosphooligosaccharide--protein glycosyltransferase subunit 2 n=1 Tax=Exocentrus adspersus TaxID=1586481 RepID=A0AAV8W349_9CUCU|nr:hypothetical protein NQ315_004711 [Exocentrus adspersus]